MLAPREKLWSVDPVVLEEALKLLDLKSDDVFMDLGCGNGKTVVAAHTTYKCRCIGVEVHEPRAKEAAALVETACPSGEAIILTQNALEVDLQKANKIYLYLIERGLRAVAARLEETARKCQTDWPSEVLVATVLYRIPLSHWKPDTVKWVETERTIAGAGKETTMKMKTPIFLYKIPKKERDAELKVASDPFSPESPTQDAE